MTIRHRPTAPLLALTLGASLTLAGCGGDPEKDLAASTATASATVSATPSSTPPSSTSPSGTDAASPAAGRTVEVTISSDQVSPQAKPVELAVGERLTLAVQSNRAAELHVHSQPERTVAIKPGNTMVQLVFDKPGQVDVEEHETDALVLRILVR